MLGFTSHVTPKRKLQSWLLLSCSIYYKVHRTSIFSPNSRTTSVSIFLTRMKQWKRLSVSKKQKVGFLNNSFKKLVHCLADICSEWWWLYREIQKTKNKPKTIHHPGVHFKDCLYIKISLFKLKLWSWWHSFNSYTNFISLCSVEYLFRYIYCYVILALNGYVSIFVLCYVMSELVAHQIVMYIP